MLKKKKTVTNYTFFETFLHVEKEFIPQKFVASWPSEGWPNLNQVQTTYQNQFSLGSFGVMAGPG